jgi:hypothetical protein
MALAPPVRHARFNVRALGKVLLAVCAVFVLMAAALYVFRDAAATKAANLVLERREGTRCTRPSLHVAASLDRLTVSPIECTIRKGPLQTFSAPDGLEITLRGFKPQLIHAKHLVMDQRARDVSHVAKKSAGKLPGLSEISDQFVKAMLDASELFAGDGPTLRADTMVSKRAGKTESVMKEFKRSSEFGWDHQTAARLEGVPDVVSIRNFDMKVTPKKGEMTVAVYLGKPDPGEKPDALLKVDGRDLNQERPQFDIRL